MRPQNSRVAPSPGTHAYLLVSKIKCRRRQPHRRPALLPVWEQLLLALKPPLAWLQRAWWSPLSGLPEARRRHCLTHQ